MGTEHMVSHNSVVGDCSKQQHQQLQTFATTAIGTVLNTTRATALGLSTHPCRHC